jgi:hypothetical protein
LLELSVSCRYIPGVIELYVGIEALGIAVKVQLPLMVSFAATRASSDPSVMAVSGIEVRFAPERELK